MKKFLTIFLVFSLLFTGVFADTSTDYSSKKVYSNSADFLKAEGDICLGATDGCNSISIIDGKLGASTMMYCEDVYGEAGQEKWSCTQYKDDYFLPDNDHLICTMEYAPVCAEVQVNCINEPCLPVQKTFGNSCTAGKNKILYNGECDSYVDIILYNKYLLNESIVLEKNSHVPKNTLNKVINLIDIWIPRTKKLKIAESIKIERVTKYVFLKNTILKFLSIEENSIGVK